MLLLKHFKQEAECGEFVFSEDSEATFILDFLEKNGW